MFNIENLPEKMPPLVPAIPKKALIDSVGKMANEILKKAELESESGDEGAVEDALSRFRIFLDLRAKLEVSRRRNQP